MVEINLSLQALTNLLKRYQWVYNTIGTAEEEQYILLQIYPEDNTYIHGFTITHDQDMSNLFTIKWYWKNGETITEKSFTVCMPTKGTVIYTDIIPINTDSPACSDMPITIEMANNMPGAFLHVGILLDKKP